MASLNKVTLIGNLGADPELRTLNSGDRVCNLRIATSDKWTDKRSGEKKERTEWHRVVIFNEHLVKVAESYLTKGMTIYIEGALQTRKWTDQAGVEKYSTEIVLQKFKGEILMLGGKGERGGDDRGGGGRYETDQGYGGGGGGTTSGEFDADLDDEIPFASPFSIR